MERKASWLNLFWRMGAPVALGLLIAGLVLGKYGLGDLRDVKRLRHDGQTIRAEVIDYQKEIHDGDTSYLIAYRFQVPGFTLVERQVTVSAREYKDVYRGSKITVIYWPKDPNLHRLVGRDVQNVWLLLGSFALTIGGAAYAIWTFVRAAQAIRVRETGEMRRAIVVAHVWDSETAFRALQWRDQTGLEGRSIRSDSMVFSKYPIGSEIEIYVDPMDGDLAFWLEDVGPRDPGGLHHPPLSHSASSSS